MTTNEETATTAPAVLATITKATTVLGIFAALDAWAEANSDGRWRDVEDESPTPVMQLWNLLGILRGPDWSNSDSYGQDRARDAAKHDVTAMIRSAIVPKLARAVNFDTNGIGWADATPATLRTMADYIEERRYTPTLAARANDADLEAPASQLRITTHYQHHAIWALRALAQAMEAKP